jgi:hypothetical protein
MIPISYKKACKSCNTTTGLKNLIMWENEDELYIDGELISENDMIKKILQFHFDTDIKCENCRAKNIWDIWDVSAGDQKLKNSNEPGIKMDLGDGRIISYQFFEIAQILDNATKRLDLGLRKFTNDERYKEIAIKISIMEAMTLMNTFFEIRLFPSKEVFNSAFDYFRDYFEISYNQQEMDNFISIIGNWESRILEDSYEGYYIFLEYEPREILPLIYHSIPDDFDMKLIYKHFRKQYFQTKQFLLHYINQKFETSNLYADQNVLNYMNKLLPSINKL